MRSLHQATLSLLLHHKQDQCQGISQNCHLSFPPYLTELSIHRIQTKERRQALNQNHLSLHATTHVQNNYQHPWLYSLTRSLSHTPASHSSLNLLHIPLPCHPNVLPLSSGAYQYLHLQPLTLLLYSYHTWSSVLYHQLIPMLVPVYHYNVTVV